MRTWLLPAAAAAMTLAGSAAMAQPYGYYGGGDYHRPAYDYGYYGYNYGRGSPRWRDSDRDGIPDRAEWNRDRDHDGRPDQWDRYDNRRDWRWRHRHYGYGRGYYPAPYWGYGYRY